MTPEQEYAKKGYTKAEVEILQLLTKLETNQESILKNYVTKDEFAPVQKLVYGLVGLVLVAVASGLIALVIR